MATVATDFPRDEDEPTRLPINKIRMDGATQPRDLIDNNVVIDYADAMLDGVVFPPVVVFYDGSHYWLGDGYHRVTAAKRAKRETIACEVRMGEKRDALLYSCGANGNHGLRRSNRDKLRAVMKLLNDDEWGLWTDRRIADVCAVTPQMVAANRVHASNPSARSNFRKAIRNGEEVIVAVAPRPADRRANPEPPVAESIPARIFAEPIQRTASNPIHEYARSLRAADIAFKQDVETGFGKATFETDDALILVVPIISAAALRDAFSTILFQRHKHAPAKKAVIVGHVQDDARPWAVLARHWKVEIKSLG